MSFTDTEISIILNILTEYLYYSEQEQDLGLYDKSINLNDVLQLITKIKRNSKFDDFN